MINALKRWGDEIEKDMEEARATNPEAYNPSLDVADAEKKVTETLAAYAEKKIFNKHTDQLKKELEEQAKKFEQCRDEKKKEKRLLEEALRGSAIQKIKYQNGTLATLDEMKQTADIVYQNAKMLTRGVMKLTAPPIIFLNMPEWNKKEYGRFLVAVNDLRHARNQQIKTLNREIHKLRRALKERNTERYQKTQKEEKDKRAYTSLLAKTKQNKNQPTITVGAKPEHNNYQTIFQ